MRGFWRFVNSQSYPSPKTTRAIICPAGAQASSSTVFLLFHQITIVIVFSSPFMHVFRGRMRSSSRIPRSIISFELELNRRLVNAVYELISRLAFKGWTFKSPQSTRPTPPHFPEFHPSGHSTQLSHEHRGYGIEEGEGVDERAYGHGLEQDLHGLEHSKDESGSTINPGTYRGKGTVRSRALSF